MIRNRAFFCIVIFCLAISSCTASPQTTNFSPTASATPKAKFTPTEAQTSTPSPTVEPSPTPIPPVIWGNSFNKIVELNTFEGVWSPTSNEMVGVEVADVRRNHVGRMVLSRAPDFSRVGLDEAHKDRVLDSLIWKPDGQEVLYGVSDGPGGILSIDYYGAIWSVGRDGTNPHATSVGFGRGLEFWGWMNAHTIVYSSFAGGSYFGISEYDVLADKDLTGDVVKVAQKGSVNPSYVPVIACLLHCTTCIITTKRVANPKVYPCNSENASAREFPRLPQEPYSLNYVDTVFQSWQPNTNNILILAQGKQGDNNKDNPRVSRLLLWNADTGQVKSIIPGGVFGRFSPDGKILAFITYGSSTQYAAVNLQKLSFDLIDINNAPTLQLMDVGTHKIIFRVPIKTEIISFGDWDAISEWETTVPETFSFSPDGRYLVFSTVGSITLKDAHFPTEAIVADATRPYLNILDLKTEQLTQSVLLNDVGEYRDLNVSWSPDSTRFVYQDNGKNWQLFELASNTITPITQQNGSQLQSPAWSYDGSYLSFEQYHFDGYDDRFELYSLTTFVLNLNTDLHK